MRIAELPDAASFLEVAAPVLDRDAGANNLPLGIARQLVADPQAYEAASFWVAERHGIPVGAAMRTAPYPAIVANPIDGDAVDAFVAWLAVAQPDLPGVTANEPWATRFADGWTEATGEPWRVAIAQGVYALREVHEPDPIPPGALRRASADDRDLLLDWIEAFADEALTAMIRDDRATERAVDARLRRGSTGGFDLWEVDGRPVSLTGFVPIAGGARVGPVYTPPPERGRGYASTLVARVSRRMLEEGAEACFLYTDLANPTSNAIYRRIGYEQIARSSMIRFADR